MLCIAYLANAAGAASVINAIDMQSRPAVFMSARLVVASCAEMAAEANIGHYMQHTINTPHYVPRYSGGSRERE